MKERIVRNIRYTIPLHFVLLLTNWLPDNVPILRLRGWLISHFLGKCEANLRVGRNVTLLNPWNIQVGKNVYIAYGSWLLATSKIVLGDEVMFGPYVVVVTSIHTKRGNSFRYGEVCSKRIEIGKGSWLGANVVILPGTKIGSGSIVGASSVVSGHFEEGILIAGIPGEAKKEI